MRFFEQCFARSACVPTNVLSVAFIAISTAAARAQTPVQYGDTITEPGLYYLDGNQSGTGDGIKIESNDVTLLLLRFTLRGDRGNSKGIFADGYDRVRIYGGRVTNFQYGIWLANAEDCTVKDTRLDHSAEAGLQLEYVDESAFSRLSCDYNRAEGVYALNGYGNRFVSILAHHNQFDGITLVNAAPGTSKEVNKVRSCWLAYNGSNGLRIRAAHDNVVTSNECLHNENAGILLDGGASGTLGPVGAHDNDVNGNWCVFNRYGIYVGAGATSNTLHDNIALANSGHDLVDDNPEPPCVNTWFLDLFFTKGGAGEDCIF